MMVKGGNFVGFGGIFNVFEVAKAFILAVYHYSCAISVVFGFANTFVAGCVVALLSAIKSVLAFCGKPKIFNPAVCAIGINVVNKDGRQLTVVKQPNQAVHFVPFARNAYVSVSMLINDASYLAIAHMWSRCFFPVKIAIDVIKQLNNFLLRDMIEFVHAVVPVKQWFGKWRLSVDSTGPLRYCTKGTA
jgi:hypothetical protein